MTGWQMKQLKELRKPHVCLKEDQDTKNNENCIEMVSSIAYLIAF